MLLKVAWRNIWRSRARSLVVMCAVTIGVWAVIFLMSYSQGMVKSYINSAIENQISHIQIHHPQFPDDKASQFYLENASDLEASITSIPEVKAATIRTITNAMVSSAKGARGIQVMAIDPANEAAVTKLDQKVTEGEFFSDRKNQILISESLAEKMNVKLRSKIVLTFQDMDNEITAGAFRIVGLFKTSSLMVDDANVYVLRKDLNKLLNKEDIGHEAAIFLNDPGDVDAVTASLREKHPDALVQTYWEISPDISMMDSQIQITSTIFMVIVMLGLIFGIINTMLMAVLERVREIGMLMAIGMNKVKVFLMIVLETLMLGVLAAPIGLALGYFMVSYLSEKGINLAQWSDSMRQFGIEEVIYPSVEPGLYPQLAIAVVITALLGSIYPAIKAVLMRPVEALQKI